MHHPFFLLPLLALVHAQKERPATNRGPSDDKGSLSGLPSNNQGSFHNNTDPNSAIFVYNGTTKDSPQLTFALNADANTGDLYFHLSSTSGPAWISVGIGSEMSNALMFVAYPSSASSQKKRRVTTSPRIADGHVEPSYISGYKIEQETLAYLPHSNTVQGEYDCSGGPSSSNNFSIIADVVCRNCTSWPNGKIDFTSNKQAFIFALGPAYPRICDSSASADLSQHSFIGKFTMDMTVAASQNRGRVPPGPYTETVYASSAQNTSYTSEPAPYIHGLVMSIVFILLFPLGSLLLRTWETVRGHYIVQILATALFILSAAGGAYISTKYNRMKTFASTHQILGILLLFGFLAQLSLGALNHRTFKKEHRSTVMNTVHKFLGPAILVVGLVNGFLGFALAQESRLSIPYAILIVIVAAIYTCIRGLSWYRHRGKAQPRNTAPESYRPVIGKPSNLRYDSAPAYAATPAYEEQPPPSYGDDGGRRGRGMDVPMTAWRDEGFGEDEEERDESVGPGLRREVKPMV